ncbi:LOW QUALITY PROTEIN: DNA repair endonuclease XPF-like [Oppia nitens]|uniref:LOW QUALITY PROTEIN: DNA repair endonuclease XPF-like n=1 Tax=Oppia nitens TaxID=1686743 RepID=UPI0023DBA902|nr:LOW QUALITY PROTEIN: DNA repair endonuclease XPF-like [Oppia nitens]
MSDEQRLLEFERQMLLDVLNENSLTIASKGIVIDRLLLQLTKTFSEKSQLVFVIGTNAEVEDYIIAELSNELSGVGQKPKRVTAESCAAADRRELYMNGGVVFMTTRILVVDMLTSRVPFELISGVIVYNAHTIYTDCLQAFIVRLYRMHNKTGFVTGLSQTAQAFTGQFSKLDRIMRYLFVTKLYLWPRFHVAITDSLSTRPLPNVIEIRLSMTPLMKKIQFALMDLISLCIKELTNSNNSFLYDCQELNAMSVISLNFDSMVRKQFDPIWYQLSAKCRRTIYDIKLLKQLLFHLTQLDSVTFYSEVKTIRDNVVLNSQTSDWLFWEPSETLFSVAKQRLYIQKNGKQVVDIEINPKLNAFFEIIKEINEETKDISQVIDIIVVVENMSTSIKLDNFRDKGMDAVLQELHEKCQHLMNCKEQMKNKSKKTNNKTQELDENAQTLTQMMRSYEKCEEMFQNEHRLDFHYHNWQQKGIHLHNMLKVLKPKYIILYEPDMQSIRQIESYQALYCSSSAVKIYFFMFDGSAEEQRYLKNLHIEKEAFETLIKTKASLVIPSDRDGKSDSHPDLVRGSDDSLILHPNTRIGGTQPVSQNKTTKRIIIDMREFRSDLPTLIHKRGIDIEPITIEIGDYILTPDTCVERKSVNDLIGSLNNGRLYTQTEVMTRYYKRPLLLIEFDDQKSFNFKSKYWGTSSITPSSSSNRPNVLSQLVVLTIHFPLLRMVWSPSPHFSAEMFEYLKKDKEEPDQKLVLAKGHQQLPAEYMTDKYDIECKEFLLCLPGININNIYNIMNSVKSINHLIELSVEELTEFMGNSKNAELLYKSLHTKVIDLTNDDINRLKNEKKFKRFANKRPKI